MKVFLIMFSFILGSFIYCQNFPRNEIDLLYNKELKVIEKPKGSQYSYSGFYSNPNLFTYGHIIEYDNYSLLAGKVFRLLSHKPDLFSTYVLKLENAEIGVIYFKYDSEDQFAFPFEIIGGLNLPDDFYCRDIKMTTDKFTDEIKYETAESEGVLFTKYIRKNRSTIYISIKFEGEPTTQTVNGAILLLENNKRIDKPNQVIRSIQNSIYLELLKTYYPSNIFLASIKLNDSDLKLLKENKITDIRLSISDRIIKDGSTLKEFLKCLINK